MSPNSVNIRLVRNGAQRGANIEWRTSHIYSASPVEQMLVIDHGMGLLKVIGEVEAHKLEVIQVKDALQVVEVRVDQHTQSILSLESKVCQVLEPEVGQIWNRQDRIEKDLSKVEERVQKVESMNDGNGQSFRDPKYRLTLGRSAEEVLKGAVREAFRPVSGPRPDFYISPFDGGGVEELKKILKRLDEVDVTGVWGFQAQLSLLDTEKVGVDLGQEVGRTPRDRDREVDRTLEIETGSLLEEEDIASLPRTYYPEFVVEVGGQSVSCLFDTGAALTIVGATKGGPRRYPIGNLPLIYFTQWVKDVFDLDLSTKNVSEPLPRSEDLPGPKLEPGFLSALEALGLPHSLSGVDRLVHAHGHTLNDMFMLREGRFPRIPDLVVWPGCHDDVVKLVQLAHTHDVVLIPFGGGTSVSGANRILWVDKENLVACCESGIVGQDLERQLQEQGLTTGHEPDSYEFSSLGGWVATRASGMKKNVYGNIEDLLVNVRMVTPTGVLQKQCRGPRISCGPDFNHIVLGSEGTLGVITEVILKVRPLPSCKKYGSIVFPNFESGVLCMREIARQRCQPASIRLMDNQQFKFGQALRPVPSYLGLMLDGLKKFYITTIKKFDVDTMCVATLLFEGDHKQVAAQENKIYEIVVKFGGIPAGEKNGERGYMLTFVIAYIRVGSMFTVIVERDLGLEHNIVAESFETSVPWDRTLSLCRNVKHCIAEQCKALGIQHFMISCRVTQTYDVGSCVYFYFGFKWTGLSNPLELYESLEARAREEILASGGSISHHHGVGKMRARWYQQQVSDTGVRLYQATKSSLDPKNIFASGNLLASKL
uniref:Alkylglycerone-phosphate synthase n=1 Tax=Timema bartmani TaxID=61472 RepID=A0A7R9EZE9_9NEOP|nr:unnamed protein product [Timema bartmani]